MAAVAGDAENINKQARKMRTNWVTNKHPADGFFNKNARVGALPLRVVVGKKLADVFEAQAAEDRIGHGVVDHVAVGMRGAAAVVLQAFAADDQRQVGLETVQIKSVADAKHVVAPRCEEKRKADKASS